MNDWTSKLRSLNLGTLFDYLPHTGLDCISWMEFLKQTKAILKVSTDPKLQSACKHDIQANLTKDWTDKKTPQLLGQSSWFDMDPEVRTIWGERVLEIFYRSLFHGGKSNLDFRAEKFFLSRDPGNASYWELSRFYVAYEPGFASNMQLLYEGYYEQRPKDFRSALVNLGILGKEQDHEEIEKLLFLHFGQVTDNPQLFSLGAFKKSYLDLFGYVRKHKKKIPANFVWLGLSLSGVYECLEKLGGAYRVREVFRRSLEP